MNSIDFMILASVVVAVIVIWDRLRSKKESKMIDTLLTEKNNLSKTNSALLESVQKTQQSQADQLNEMSKTILDVSKKMTDMQLNLQNVIDSKLKSQSEKFERDMEKVNDKVDTILGMVMECDSKNCPTKRKVSNYLKSNKNLKKEED